MGGLCDKKELREFFFINVVKRRMDDNENKKKGAMLGGGLHVKQTWWKGIQEKVREANFLFYMYHDGFFWDIFFYLGAGQNGRNLFSCLRTFFSCWC